MRKEIEINTLALKGFNLKKERNENNAKQKEE